MRELKAQQLAAQYTALCKPYLGPCFAYGPAYLRKCSSRRKVSSSIAAQHNTLRKSYLGPNFMYMAHAHPV